MTITYSSSVVGYNFYTDDSVVDSFRLTFSTSSVPGMLPDETDAAIKAFADVLAPHIGLINVSKIIEAGGVDDWIYIPS